MPASAWAPGELMTPEDFEMKRKTFWLGVVALLGATTLPSTADDPKPGDAAAQEAQAGDVELLAAAYQMAAIGEKEKLPEAYVAAGSLVLKLKARCKGEMGRLDVVPEVQDENDKPLKGVAVETQKSENLDDLAQEFFDAASALAKDPKTSAAVEALIKSAKTRTYAPGTRGAVGGPKWFTRVLGPHQTHVYKIPFDTYSVGSVGFQASAPTRCTMNIGGYVHFNQVVSVGNYTWQPKPDREVKTYTISVHNGRHVPVTYKVFTN